MPHINLLPWRENQREERRRDYIAIFGMSFVATIGLLFLVHLYFSGEVSGQKNRNQYLTQQIKILDKRIAEIKILEKTREQLLTRMSIIHGLQQQRPLSVNLFDELVRVLPNGVYLKEIKQNESRVTVVGKSESNARVSQFMRNIEKSKFFTNPVLTQIKTPEKNKGVYSDFDFSLVFTQPGLVPVVRGKKA